MIWAYRIAIGIGLLIAVLYAALIFISVVHDPSVISSLGNVETWTWIVKAELIVVIPIWSILRVIDFIAGGPSRRKTKRQLSN
jgi:hypothetical protein